MFSGEFSYKMDSKGRVSVPAPFRTSSDGRYYITYGPDGCLFVYDEAGFKERAEALGKLDDFDSKVRQIKRVFFSGPGLQECDSHGRIKIPGILAEYAEIEKDVVMNGMSSHFEIWGKERWNEQRQQDIANYFQNYKEMTSKTVGSEQ
ncbi:MAG: division/cell wall cluster transcriptional repressor MraZ [Chlamydiae bacterium]|nr:MAG: division/cell wall cluster transcriptional repressor MraZ [Chlamydiota bacterium]